MKICQLTNSTEKQAVTRSILEALPEWFGIPEAREDYITSTPTTKADKQPSGLFVAAGSDSVAGVAEKRKIVYRIEGTWVPFRRAHRFARRSEGRSAY